MVTHLSAYTASKAAVAALTESVAKELEPFGVRLNAISPGAFATRFMDPLVEAGPSVVGDDLFSQVEEQRDQPIDYTQLDALLRFLLDPESAFITGRVLSARWESPDKLRAEALPVASARYRLRRIDEDLYTEVVRTVPT
jgi:NAD(P)-dependent dehydrogenase (short-subunit alcohol dehydrogenase family)